MAKASKFLDARKITPAERVSASQKLGAAEARALARAARKLIIARRGKVVEHAPGGKPTTEMIEAMLGATGNLRTPTLRAGDTVVVGFDSDTYAALLG